MDIKCPVCGKIIEYVQEFIVADVRCKHCGKIITVQNGKDGLQVSRSKFDKYNAEGYLDLTAYEAIKATTLKTGR